MSITAVVSGPIYVSYSVTRIRPEPDIVMARSLVKFLKLILTISGFKEATNLIPAKIRIGSLQTR